MSFVYFIQEGMDGPIKIGRSTDPWKRLEALQSGNPRPLRLIAATRVGKSVHILERDLHRDFRDLHLLGEWYSPGPELVSKAAVAGMPVCESCQLTQERLRMWKRDFFDEPIALCFKCLNSAEAEKLRATERPHRVVVR